MYVCMHVRLYVCMHVRVLACVRACMYVCVYVRTHARTYVRMYVCMYVCMYVYVTTEETTASQRERESCMYTPFVNNLCSHAQYFSLGGNELATSKPFTRARLTLAGDGDFIILVDDCRLSLSISSTAVRQRTAESIARGE